MGVDLVLHNGAIFSPERPSGRPEPLGVACAGERIVAVGPDRDVLAMAGPGARRVDLRGRLVVPGFNDAHIHFTDGGFSLLQVDARGVRSEEELAARAVERARAAGPGRWVTGRGWDQHLFGGGRWPTRAALDRLLPDTPVLLRRHCGHAGLASGAALRAAGIGRETPDPPGGRIGRDPATGEPDGLVYETAVERVMAAVPPPSREERLAGLRTVSARARAAGLTSVQDERGDLDLYLELDAAGELTARVSVWARILTPLDELEAWRASYPAGHPRLRPGLLKGYLDGSLGARTALFHEPYADAPDTCGVAVLDPADVVARVVAADARGFQVGLHAIGDRACTTALDAFAAARARNGPRDARHRIEHAQNLRPADLARFRALGAVASMQPSHCTGDIAFAAARLGPERSRGAYAWRSLLAAGAALAFGSDFPIETLDPRVGLYAAVTRLPLDGSGAPFVPAERLTLASAIDLHTRGAAHAEFAEAEKGTLEPGKLADLVVLAEDIFAASAADPRRLLDIPVDLTIVGGRVVHHRLGGTPNP